MNPIHNDNRLKLGIFCYNTLSVVSLHPDVWRPAWADCVRAAQAADAMGLEALVPIARWKGYVDGDPDNATHTVFDAFTFAAGIAQATRNAAVFATVHGSVFHPLIVAKQSATIDHISGGRFCLNVVGGVNRREFEMMGIDLLGHDERYAHLDEWLAILKRLWSDTHEFDHDSRWFPMRGAISRPQPLQGGAVPIMNAGASPQGVAFAAKNSDLMLTTLRGPDPAGWGAQVRDCKALARETYGRDVQVWTNAMVTIRDTQAEADTYLRAYAEEQTDHAAVDSFADTIRRENNIVSGSEIDRHLKRGIATGVGYPVVGTPATCAATLQQMSEAGVDGVILTFVDFDDGLDRFARQVLPLLEAAALRSPFGAERRERGSTAILESGQDDGEKSDAMTR